MPRVLYLTDSLGNGGAERQLALMAKSLPSAWERRVWSLMDGPFAQVLRDGGIRVDVRKRHGRFDATPALDLWRVLATWRPDVVHSWGWMSSLAAGPACKVLGIPLVDGAIRMGMIPPWRRRTALWLMRRSIGWATRVVANSRAGLIAWGIDPERGRVVYNGFDVERLAAYASSGQRPYDPFTVVMTGRMTHEKDFRTFFASARQVADCKEPNWRFIAIGHGPNRNALLDETEELVKCGVASFPDATLEVIGVVRHAHVGVLVSDPVLHAEGCSNSIMEYMACGLPVVCSDGGGNRELVIEGETGFIIPPRAPQVLAEKLLWLRAHPREASRMGQAGQTRIMSEFTVEKMVNQTLAVYGEVASLG